MSERLRLADLLGGLSIVSDLGYGLPVDTALRSCLIGTALARQCDLPEREVADVFYAIQETAAQWDLQQPRFDYMTWVTD